MLRGPASSGLRMPLAAAGLVLAAAAAPLLAILFIAARPSGTAWSHLVSTVLPGATWTTILLMAGVGSLAALFGVGTAWLVSMFRFPGRSLLEVALVLPLSIPTYLAAYCYVELFDYTGPVQSALRSVFGFETARDYWFPEIRSLPGAVLTMAAVLYPYVYMTVRVLFLTQSARALDVAATLGCTPSRLFFRVGLPLARPAVAIGVSLALMETINDIGAVDFFGVRTLTFAIYQTWLNRGNLPGAAQLACVLLIVVFALIAAERAARGRQRYDVSGARHPLPRFELSGWRAAAAAFACAVPVILGFLVPVALMADYASRRLGQFADPALHAALFDTVAIAGFTAIVTIAAGLVLVYAVRLSRSAAVGGIARLASLGYAVPGTVLAVGILYPLAAFDNWFDSAARALFGISTGLLLTGSGAAIVYACSVRFLAIAYGMLEAGIGRITDRLDMAARTLGRTPRQTLLQIHVPLMRRALFAAALLVFVDTTKELSATLLLRPFNFETLATFIYSKASRGFFEDASAAALVIVAAGIPPLLLLFGFGARALGAGPMRPPQQAS